MRQTDIFFLQLEHRPQIEFFTYQEIEKESVCVKESICSSKSLSECLCVCVLEGERERLCVSECVSEFV